ncbi:MAG: MBL fold metallo-hydrolase [Clostridia bacterium]
MEFAPLFSGSSGNAIYVRANETRLLVDAGLSGNRMQQELEKLDVEPGQLDALLITHEHADHVAGAGIFSRRYDLPVYATEGTWQAMSGKLGRIAPKHRCVIVPGQDFYVGDMNVLPFPIPHDAAQPVGFSFSAGGLKAAIATDIGHICETWLGELAGSDLVLLESNHDVEMLKAGRYPYALKRRILGDRGHLSNEDAGRAAVCLAERGVKHIILGHLSGENNFPALALQAVCYALDAAGLTPGEALGLDVARRDGLSGRYCLSSGEDAHE